MSVLAAQLSLGEGPGRIEDVEALVRKVVDDRLRQWGARLKDFDHDDLVSYLIGVCWELSGRYDPAKDRNPNFAAYAARILTLRVADWYRQRFGDTRHGERPIVLSLDAPATLSGGDSSEGYGADRLVDTLASSVGDPAVDRSPDLVGILERRGGGGAGPHDPLGEPPARRAPRRNRSAAGVSRSKARPRVPGTYRAPQRAPICPNCFKTFKKAYLKVNAGLDEGLQRPEEEVIARAAKRAQAVKFGSEWACPRCTKLEGEAQDLLLAQAYPNRAARRAKVASTKRNNNGSRKGG